MKVELKRYQGPEGFLSWAKGRHWIPMLADMGTGKTVMALAWLEYLVRPKKALILCETDKAGIWLEEARSKSDLPTEALIGTVSARKTAINKEFTVLIAGYDALDSQFGKYLQAIPWDAIIVDESTALKKYKAKRTKLACRLSRRASYRMIMTGTFITNSLFDVWSQFLFLDYGETFNKSFWWFRKQYFYLAGFEWLPKRDTKEKIQKILDRVAFRVAKKDALPNLPPKIKHRVGVDLHPTAKRFYDTLVEKWILELPAIGTVDTRHVIAKRAKLAQLCSGYLKSDEGRVLRMPCNKLYRLRCLLLDRLEKGRKVVVWCRFQFEVLDICRLLNNMGVGRVFLYGDAPAAEAVTTFQTDPDTKVFITTMRKGAKGLTLTKGSSNIYYGKDPDVELRAQSEDRTHRIGSEGHSHIDYFDLYTRSTVEEESMTSVDTLRLLAKKTLPASTARILLAGK